MEEPIKKKRGFACMSPERRREIASKGGRHAQAMGRAHRFSHEEAVAAGQKGGQAVSQDRAHMAAIGKRERNVTNARRHQTPREEP